MILQLQSSIIRQSKCANQRKKSKITQSIVHLSSTPHAPRVHSFIEQRLLIESPVHHSLVRGYEEEVMRPLGGEGRGTAGGGGEGKGVGGAFLPYPFLALFLPVFIFLQPLTRRPIDKLVRRNLAILITLPSRDCSPSCTHEKTWNILL